MPLSEAAGSALYLVIGREGSLRTQRKNGSAWLLRGSPCTRRGFVYQETSMACASRSGHSAVAVSSDRVLVLDHGEVVELGTHAQLLAAKGLYSTLHELQFQDSSVSE